MAQPVVHLEIIGRDPARLRTFYAELFGWQFDTSAPISAAVSEAGNYGFTDGPQGDPVPGGVGGGPDFEPHVMFYVGVEDIEATLAKAEGLGGTVEQHRIAQRLGGCDEDEQLRLGREQEQARRVALLDPADDGFACGKTESAGDLSGVPRAWQLEERERVAVALGDDLLQDGRIERPVHVLEQQRACIALVEPAERQLGKPREDVVAPIEGSDRHTICPYKGVASYHTIGGHKDIAWYYPEPLPGVEQIKDRVAFWNERTSISTRTT